MLSDKAALGEAQWGVVNDVLKNAEQRQLARKLWIAATAEGFQVAGMQRRELAIPQSTPHSAVQIADTVAGGSLEAAKPSEASREESKKIGFEPDEATKSGPPS